MNILHGIAATAVVATVISTNPVQAQGLEFENAASIVRGGQLYDKWWKITKSTEPSETHSAYQADTGRDGSGTWRCKECHGWDYIGPKGRYSSGSHYTGIKGIEGLAGGDPTEISASIRGGPHNFSAEQIDDASMADLANFVSQGQFDMSPYIADGKSTGDAAVGEPLYATLCAGCHGADGAKIKEMPPLGEISGNPQETMHKILFGQPAEAMPALYVFGPQVAADITAYLHTLPQ
jgi:thiosulfate dehydrogenase